MICRYWDCILDFLFQGTPRRLTPRTLSDSEVVLLHSLFIFALRGLVDLEAKCQEIPVRRRIVPPHERQPIHDRICWPEENIAVAQFFGLDIMKKNPGIGFLANGTNGVRRIYVVYPVHRPLEA